MMAMQVKAILRQALPSGDVYRLAGPRNVGARQSLMIALTGTRHNRSQCGVNALRDVIYSIIRPTGDCMAAREKCVERWINSD